MPADSPVTTQRVAGALITQPRLPFFGNTLYEAMSGPPLVEGRFQVTVILPELALARTLVGADGSFAAGLGRKVSVGLAKGVLVGLTALVLVGLGPLVWLGLTARVRVGLGEGNSAFATFSFNDARTPSFVASIVTWPRERPLTEPRSLTLATDLFEELHLTSLNSFC